MGCTSSIMSSNKERRGSKVTIESLESNLTDNQAIKKRYGHPSYYKGDGYEVGLRVKVKSNNISYFVGTRRSSGEKVTVKEFHTAQYSENDAAEEIQLLVKLSHDCIPKVSEIFITNISVFMISNFLDSMRLKHFVDLKTKTSKLSLADTRKIARSVISATAYCHSQNVVVRNLTADNIMVKSTGKDLFEVMICDFSLAVPNGSLKVLCDHPLFEWNDVPFMAPEALLGHPYSFAMDVWSVGVLLFMMVSGELPFDSPDDKELVNSIKHASFEFAPSNPVWAAPANDKVKYLIGEMLVATPADRPSSKEILKNPWLVMG